jgi:hypothetical protein
MYNNGHIVCTGTWFYDDNVKTGIAIQKMPIIYGSGDYEDPPEFQDDQEVENYYIWFSTAGSLIDFRSGAGYGLSLDEAKTKAEKLAGQRIAWTDNTSEIRILLSSDSDENKFGAIVDILINKLHLDFTDKISGLDQKYWDFKFKDSIFTLHQEHYLGIMIFPKDEITKKTLDLLIDLETEIKKYWR